MVQYELLKSSISGDIDEIDSGINYITSKDYDISPFPKHLEFLNFKSEYNQSYLVTFYSPNCKFDLDWVYNETTEKILINDSAAQKIIEPLDTSYYGDKFDFYYTIIKGDEALYPKKLCVVYTSGLEMSTSQDNWNGRSISLSEGVPHRYNFSNEYPFIVYAYHVSETTQTLVINFNLIDKENFDIFIYINGISYNNKTIFSNSQFYIKEIDFKQRCNIYEVCAVIVKVQMKIFNGNKAVEIVMYQIDNNPFYLEKNVIREDILHGNKAKFYYFGIGKGEYGDITLDFKRGSGNIYASVEERKLDNDKPLNRSEWRGLYHFPMSFSESLDYELFGKKVIIKDNDTDKCSGGCYVLITIINNIRYSNNPEDETFPFRISIIPRIMRTDPNFPVKKVRVNVNEFVVGNIIYDFGERRKYDYYSLILPYDSYCVIIDWQAETPSLFLNVGSERPTLNNTHFSFTQFDYDTIYNIKKGSITPHTDKNNLKGVELTIGIYSNVSETMKSSPYAFRIFMPQPDSEGIADKILHIKSDQKMQCIPKKYKEYKDEYLCLFAMILDDIKTSMVIYPRNQHGYKVTTYGKLVSTDIIKSNDNDKILDLFIEIFKNKEYKIDKDYIYMEETFKNQSYFFITSTGDNKKVVEVLSSVFMYDNNMDVYPNPSTAQIFAIGNHKINFHFLASNDIILNINNIAGSGLFYWKDESGTSKKYYSKGFEDRLTLIPKNKKKNQLISLKVESLANEDESKTGGFIFYTTYSPSNYIEYLRNESNTEINYEYVKMPLNYYSQVKIDASWTINFNLYDLSMLDNNNLIYDKNPFMIWATIIPRDDILEAKFDPTYKPNYNSSYIKATIDTTFANIFISRDDILKKYTQKNPTEPSIFLSIEKSKEVQSNFSSMGFELNVYSGRETIPEGIYIMNKLSNSENNKFIYFLKCDINRPYFIIQYSANSNLTKFVLSTNSQSEENDKIDGLTIKEEYGSYILKVKFDKTSIPKNNSIFFIVFSKEKLFNKKLGYFSFKYMSNTEKINFCSLLEQSKSDIQVDIKDNNYKISFYPINYINTSYYIKALYIDEIIKGEKMDSIAISESRGKYMQINSPEYIRGEQLSYDLNSDKIVRYIKVMARMNYNDQKIFCLYNPIEVNTNIKHEMLSEGIPHVNIFSKEYPVMFYGYRVSDIKRTLVINIKLIEKLYFDIYIYINNKIEKNVTIYRNEQFNLKEDDFKNKCNLDEPDEVCIVNIKIQINQITTSGSVETTAYQIDDNPFYLEKNIIKQDTLHGNKVKHYYFDIDKGVYGDITLDFKRGSGNIYASVVNINKTIPMNDSDWMNAYTFPITVEESLKYKTYGKKIIITDKDTEKCSEGCYVLISIVCNVNYHDIFDDEAIPFHITIIPRTFETGPNPTIPIVKIYINEFIIGDISLSTSDKRNYDYYRTILTYDSDSIIFDWQADSPSLIVNIGEERPTINNSHFSFPQIGSHYVYKLNKSEIISKGNLTTDSLIGLELTLGIYSNVIDNIQTSPYAFKIFIPPKAKTKELQYASEIIHIRSDQKVQCLPFEYENSNICLFAVIVDDIDIKSNMIIFPKSKDGSQLTIYGNLVNAEVIGSNNITEISNLMKEIFNKKEYRIYKNYIYIERIVKSESFLFMTSINNKKDIIEVLSSTFIYRNDMNFYPNPSTAQIFAIDNYKINLCFASLDDLLLNIVSVSGQGKFNWGDKNGNNKTYYLKGYKDRLILTTYTENITNQLAPLKVESLTNDKESDSGGFIFYITYYPRSYIDQLKRDRNTEINYRSVIMPLNYYVPIAMNNSWTINFNLYDLSIQDDINLVYNETLFNIWGKIITNKEIIQIRFDPKYKPNYDSSCIKGIFESTFGIIFISSDYIKNNTNITEDENPVLFFSIENSQEIKTKYTSLGLELNIYSDYKTSGNESVPKGIFLNDKLLYSNNKKLIYLLNTDINQTYFKLEFASISDSIKFVISTDKESEKNDDFTNLVIKELNGRYITTFKLDTNFYERNNSLYLIVFTKDNNINNKLDYFSFKYNSSIDEKYFNLTSHLETSNLKVTMNKENNNYKISFYPLINEDISYYIKAYYKEGFIEGEKINTIAISESPGKYMQINNPESNENEQLSYELITDKEVKYIKIMARLSINDDKIFLLYNTVEIKEENNDDNGDDNNLGLILGIVIPVSVIIIVVVVILSIKYIKKKREDKKNKKNGSKYREMTARDNDNDNDKIELFNDNNNN